MPRNFGGTSSKMTAGSAPFTGTGTFITWIRVATVAQQGSQFALLSDGGTTNISLVGTDRTGSTGKITSYQSKSGTSSAATTAVAQTANTWQLVVGAFGGFPNNQVSYLAGANKVTANGIVSPPGLNAFQIGGRGTFDMAHMGVLTRLPTDLEVAALNAVFLNPRALPLQNYYYINQTATETDQIGAINLTVASTNSVSGDPNIATWFIGSAISNQSWTQNSAITNVDLTTKFDNGVASTAAWTGTLKQLGAAGTTTNASAAGTASTALQTAVALTAGQWVTVGSNALTPVLYVSGTTALLATALTWNNGDTVTPYPVSALSITGISVNGSNALTGTPTVNGTFSNCLIQATNNTNAAAIAYSNLFSINIASAGAAASFTAGPALTSATTDGYIFSGTSNQTGTWYTAILAKGSATPTAAQVRTGSPTGFISRFSVAVTAATPATQTVNGLTFPFHDVYHVLNNGNGDSAISQNLALFKVPPTGQQYVTLSLVSISAITKANPAAITTSGSHGRTTGDWVEVIGVAGMTQINGAWTQCTVVDSTHLTLNGIDSTGYTTYTSGGNVTWGRSSIKDSSVPLVSGDVFIADATDGQGNAVTFTQEGVAIFATTSTARQSFNKNAYDVSTANFIGTALDYENDSPPIAPGGATSLPFVLFPLNQAVTQAIASFFTDPQGDDLTQSGRITALTSLPANRTLSSAGVLSGTATTSAVTPVTFQATNASGESSTFTLNIVDGGVVVPNGIGLASSDADTLTQSNFLTDQFGQQDDPNPAGPAALGVVIAQTPSAGTVVTPGTLVTYTTSSGNAPPTQGGGSTVTPQAATLKSPQLRMEEGLNALQSYGLFKPFGVNYLGANDITNTVYRFFRLPSSAIVTQLEIMNDANPTGSLYKLGVLATNNGTSVTPGSDSVLFPSLSLDTARPGWTSIFIPATASGPISIANVGKRVWELLGLARDPATAPGQNSQDVFYDVALTAVKPGTTGGYVAIRMEYSRGPDRGLIAGAGVQ